LSFSHRNAFLFNRQNLHDVTILPEGIWWGNVWLVTTILLFLFMENVKADFRSRERRRSGNQKWTIISCRASSQKLYQKS